MGISRKKYDHGQIYSQMLMLQSKKALITGVANPQTPGSIHVIIYPDYQKCFEIQIHSEPVTKMILNYENNLLFTGSEDGSISFMALIDLDRRPKMPRTPVNHTSEVIVQGRLRNRLLHEIKVKTAELEEKKNESMTKLKLMK